MKTVPVPRSLVVVAAASLAAVLGLLAVAPPARADTPAPAAAPVTVAPAPASVPQLPSFAPLAESVKSAVVNVEVASKGGRGGGGFRELFEQNFRGGPPVRQGMGSGFIIDARGYILTNNHVVEGADVIRVRFDDGRVFDGQVLGTDAPTDVALVKLTRPPAHLPVLKLGDSDAIRVGDWVMAIGNPFGLASSVSVGIVSAKARNINAGSYDDFLQTDAAINPGNSGGPLFNLRGEVIGINTAIVSGGSGIGFAVPSNLAKALIPQLEKNGSVTRGFLGLSLQNLTPELARALGVSTPHGALVTQAIPDQPAARAGLKQDDVITRLDGQPVTSDDQLRRTVALRAPGTTVTLTLVRAGKEREVQVTLAARPGAEEISRRAPGERGSHDESSKKQFGLTLATPGVEYARARGMPRGAQVMEVEPGSPADKAKLEPGLLIIEAGGQPVTSAGDLTRILNSAKPGSIVLLRAQVGAGDQANRILFALEVP